MMNNYPYNRPDPQDNYESGNGYGASYSNDEYRTVQAPYRASGSSQPNGEPPKKKRGVGKVVGGAIAGVAAGAIIMSAIFVPQLSQKQRQPEVTQQVAATDLTQSEQTAEPDTGSPTTQPEIGGNAIQITDANNPVPEIAETAGKSVVGVTTYTRSYVSGHEPIEQGISSGTGFVISADGLILTNHHVIDGGNAVKITTSDGTEYDAEILGSDPNTEVAVLRVENLNLPALAIGNSDEAKTGEMVVAIGNPVRENLSGTVTVGYLSGTNRLVELDNGAELDMLQMDAAINPGNSGGPLLNSKGEVIGINTMKTVYASRDAYGNAIAAEGLGFAVPINTAMNVSEQIVENGSVPLEPKIGIGFTYKPISEEDAQMWQVPAGIMVTQVYQGSPANKVGLQVSDVITQIDGVDLTSGAEVPTFDDRQIGDSVPATVWRNGRTYDIEFILGDLNGLAQGQ